MMKFLALDINRHRFLLNRWETGEFYTFGDEYAGLIWMDGVVRQEIVIMNIEDLKLNTEKPVSTRNLLHGDSVVTLMQVKAGAEVSEHQSKTPALLILISGEVSYVEKNREVAMSRRHDFIEIKPHVTHKLIGKSDATLLLIQ